MKSVLKDVEEDSELRIKAYLALVECPCPKTADTIKDLIDNEPINQGRLSSLQYFHYNFSKTFEY